MKNNNGITQYFGGSLAQLLADKISKIYPSFDSNEYIQAIEMKCVDKSYTQRIDLHATELRTFLPTAFKDAVHVLTDILGDENPNETGMFKYYYWVMPLGKFVEKYGLDDYDLSIKAIS
ncbi:MAG: 3-methyladenine DNA glycosylase, partial [Ghiorsea sp.]|nr:3-methyladenine DNA glycosylase [Ghiorsea sp.]